MKESGEIGSTIRSYREMKESGEIRSTIAISSDIKNIQANQAGLYQCVTFSAAEAPIRKTRELVLNVRSKTVILQIW